ncbi:MAG TPA: hypothetical protein VN647_02410 [Nitrospira sp.]|nr:hypothetical protein [Nitrospira sp.]
MIIYPAGRYLTTSAVKDQLQTRNLFSGVDHDFGRAVFTEDDIGSQLASMNLTRLLIDIPDDRHWVVGGIIY